MTEKGQHGCRKQMNMTKQIKTMTKNTRKKSKMNNKDKTTTKK